MHRWRIISDQYTLRSRQANASRKGKKTVSKFNSRPHPRTTQIAAFSSSFVHYALKRLPPIRDTCSSGSGSPSGLPCRRSDVSATAELLTTPGCPLGSPVFWFIGTAELVLMLPECNASSYEHWKRLWPALRSTHAQKEFWELMFSESNESRCF